MNLKRYKTVEWISESNTRFNLTRENVESICDRNFIDFCGQFYINGGSQILHYWRPRCSCWAVSSFCIASLRRRAFARLRWSNHNQPMDSFSNNSNWLLGLHFLTSSIYSRTGSSLFLFINSSRSSGWIRQNKRRNEIRNLSIDYAPWISSHNRAYWPQLQQLAWVSDVRCCDKFLLYILNAFLVSVSLTLLKTLSSQTWFNRFASFVVVWLETLEQVLLVSVCPISIGIGQWRRFLTPCSSSKLTS